MRVYRINAVYGIGSTGRTALQLDEALRKNGGVSRCAHAYGPVNDGCYRMRGRLGGKLHALLARLFGNAGYYSRHATKKLLADIDAFAPDVVHLHNLHSNFVCVPMLLDYLASNDIPTVVTLHDCWFFTGKCCHYTSAGCARWQDGCGGCPRLRRDIPSWFFDRTRRCLRDKEGGFAGIRNLAVVGVSDWITGEAKKSILKTAPVIRRIYNWIDTDVFSPRDAALKKQEMGLDGYQVLLGVATAWSDAKGLGEIIALSGLLGEKQVIALVGSVPSYICLPPNVLIIPGTDDPAELAGCYSMADVFLAFSPEESFGKAAAEALSCGTPVIAVASTANPELVGEGCGFLIDKGDIEGAKSAVDTVARLGSAFFSERCRAYARENFEMNACIGQYLALYEELKSRQDDAGEIRINREKEKKRKAEEAV